MTTCPPADIGMSLEEVDTPALLIDLDAFERNLERLAASLSYTNVRLRPHAKTHKCPVIALRQMALGAVGVCCQKVSEAEALVYGGVSNVLITNEIVGTQKLRRAASLVRLAEVAVCADDAENVAAIDKVALDFNVQIPVYVELNVGADRCGVESGQPVLALAREIDAAPGLRFAGLQAYHGSAQHVRGYEERRTAIASAVEKVSQSLDLLKRHGLPCHIVTGAGTGTYHFEAESGVYNELQAGSYIFMDADYAKNLDEDGKPVRTFDHSLFVYTTVMSRPCKDWAVVDAGHKSVSIDSGMPWVDGMEGVEYIRASDEHGKLEIHKTDCPIRIGDKIKLIPGHCDPTVNLFDWYVGVRSNRVETIWPITARGAVL
ncbi:MAG: DSD1 family PLP-dependent enzyme [Deltaproteobacteria bacterium]|nr:DSD1 family PLP-dependent enzyme [Deltaproteobacteria bacterium]MBW2306327.1 DSD1 family PLP-dependent enzyme [Deltaproteobacteria bacterium]